MSDYLSPEDLAAELPMGLSAVYRALKNGSLPGVKVGNKWITSREQLAERIADGRTPKPAQDPMPKRRSFQNRVIDLDARRVANG